MRIPTDSLKIENSDLTKKVKSLGDELKECYDNMPEKENFFEKIIKKEDKKIEYRDTCYSFLSVSGKGKIKIKNNSGLQAIMNYKSQLDSMRAINGKIVKEKAEIEQKYKNMGDNMKNDKIVKNASYNKVWGLVWSFLIGFFVGGVVNLLIFRR